MSLSSTDMLLATCALFLYLINRKLGQRLEPAKPAITQNFHNGLPPDYFDGPPEDFDEGEEWKKGSPNWN